MTQILLFLAYFLLPFGEIFRFDFGNGIVISPLDILAGINLIYVLFMVIKNPNTRKHPIVKALLLFTGVGIISLVFNAFFFTAQDVAVGSLYLLRWVSLASFFITGLLTTNKTKNLFYLFISGLIFGFFGILQFFFYPNLRNLYYAGWDEHYYRLFSTFLDPNFAGIFLVLAFLTGFFLLLSANLGKPKRILFILSNLFILICIFLTFSRSAFLALFSGLFVLFLFLRKSRKYILIGVFLCIAAVIFIMMNAQFNEGTKLFRAASSLARIESLHDSFIIFIKNPIIGTGFNLYRYAAHKYNIAAGPNWEVSHSGAGVENSFAFVLATTGIVGFLAFIYLGYSIVKNALVNNVYKAFIISLIIAGIVSSFFVNSLFFPEILVWLWIVLGLTESKKL